MTNYHTHTTFCDGKNTPEEMVVSALERGFTRLGFTSHSDMLTDPAAYVSEIRRLAEKYATRIWLFCGLELELADIDHRSSFIINNSSFDYIIGSHHYLTAPDGSRFAIDNTPEELALGVRANFDGDWMAFARAYYAAIRSTLKNDFEVVGHVDLIRKFNSKCGFFSESDPTYLGEIEATADAIADSGKVVEVNTGAISRGWMDDAYPSKPFRELLRARGVRFVLSSDAHSADALDCAFDRFASAETYLDLQ